MKKLRKILDSNLTPEEIGDILEEVIQSKHDADLKKDWGKKLHRSFGISKEPTGRRIGFWNKRTLTLITAIAATFLMIAIALNIFSPFSKTPQFLASSYVEAIEIYHPGFNKGATEATNEYRKNAVMAFNNSNYSEAITYFSLIESQHRNAQDEYFTGLAYLLSQNYETAIQQFTLVPTTKDAENYIAGSNWYLSLSLLLNKEEEKAKIVLSDIIKSGNSANRDKAQTLLKAMK